MPHHNQFIRCLENIMDLSLQNKNKYAILFADGSCYSKKTITYNTKTKKFKIINHIDNTKQALTAKQIMNKKYTNINEAMKKRSIIAIID